MKHGVDFRLNGAPARREVIANTLLIDLLRDDVGLKRVKRSCDMQVCGAWAVLVDDLPISSCATLAVDMDSAAVTTIEGLGADDELDPVQAAFVAHGALQCGFCTPGFVLAIKALLAENPKPTRDEIVGYLSGDICRCTGYKNIIEAVESLV